jgi:tetratricopeptide (TPR) repeat protein
MVLLPVGEQGASNVIRKSALCTCVLLGAAMAATGQSRQENLTECQSGDTDSRIAGCTALIQAGQDTTKNLSVIYNNRGSAYNGKRDYDRAIQDYNEAIRLNPSYSYTYRERGLAYNGKRDYDRAIQDYNEAIRLNPSDASAYSDRGLAYEMKDDYDRAIQDLDAAIHLNPNLASAYENRGNAYEIKDDYDRAIPDFNEAIRLDPSDTSAYYDRGVAYYDRGDYDRAIQDYNEVIRLQPKVGYAVYMRGYAYLLRSNRTAAIADFEDVISRAPSSRTAVFAALMLHVLMKRQGHDDALQLAPVAAVADLSKWPGPVLKFDLGQVTANEVMTAAASPGSDRQRWRVCEADYFIGEDALLHHQRATALAHLRAARDGCPKGDTEYATALAELKLLGASAVPAK